MKKLILLYCLLFSVFPAHAQNVDESIKSVCNDLAQRAAKKHVIHLGILDFKNETGRQDPGVLYIQEQVEMNLVNQPDLEIMDRKHIVELLRDNRLISDGLIDESTVKKAVSFIKVDAWVVGEITNFGDVMKLKLKIIDVNTSQMFAAAMTNVDINEINKITAPKPCKYCKGTGQLKTTSKCAICNGTGGPTCTLCSGTGLDVASAGLGGHAACTYCKGKGKIACPNCGGKGLSISYLACYHCNGSGKSL
jgi:hypothetical protein